MKAHPSMNASRAAVGFAPRYGGRRWAYTAVLIWFCLGVTGCLAARAVERNYYVLHGDPVEPGVRARPVDGLVRVRDMDTDTVYEKFQIVVRRSPYQLRYSEQNVWAVRPNQMVSDLIAQALERTHTFTGVTRQLLDARPQYTLAGKVIAIELFDSGDMWYAHLSLQLNLTRFGDGASIWAYEYDQRKKIDTESFEHGARALSELLHGAIAEAIQQVRVLDETVVTRAPGAARPARPAITEPPSAPDSTPEVLYVPEGIGRAQPTGVPAGTATSTSGEVTQR